VSWGGSEEFLGGKDVHFMIGERKGEWEG